MRISLVILCQAEITHPQSVVTSYLMQSRPLDEIIVVCGHNTPNTTEFFKNYSGIKFIESSKQEESTLELQALALQEITGDVCIISHGEIVLENDFVQNVYAQFNDKSNKKRRDILNEDHINYITLCDQTEVRIQEKLQLYFRSFFQYFYIVSPETFAFRVLNPSQSKKNKIKTKFSYQIFSSLFKKRGGETYTTSMNKRKSTENLDKYVQRLQLSYKNDWNEWEQFVTDPHDLLEIMRFSIKYLKNFLFAIVLFVLPFLSVAFSFTLILGYSALIGMISIIIAFQEKKFATILVLPGYIFLRYIRAYVFIEQWFIVSVFSKNISRTYVQHTFLSIVGMMCSVSFIPLTFMFVHIFVYKIVFTLLSLVLFSNFAAQGATYWLNHSNETLA